MHIKQPGLLFSQVWFWNGPNCYDKFYHSQSTSTIFTGDKIFQRNIMEKFQAWKRMVLIPNQLKDRIDWLKNPEK